MPENFDSAKFNKTNGSHREEMCQLNQKFLEVFLSIRVHAPF